MDGRELLQILASREKRSAAPARANAELDALGIFTPRAGDK